jgi:hypothetical protein
MIDFLIAVILIVVLRTMISPIGALVRWIYNGRVKPLSFYIKEDGNQNSGIAIFFLVATLTLIYFTVKYFFSF